MTKRPRFIYEVEWPMPYCEVYRVLACSKREALAYVEKHKGNADLNCIGEIASRRRRAFKVKGEI